MNNRRYTINREGKPLKKAQSFSSNHTPSGLSVESQIFNLRQLRDQTTELAQKRKAGELPCWHRARNVFSLNITEEMEQVKEKVRKLEVPSDFRVDTSEMSGPVFNVGDILDGSVALPASHAGEEFLDILLNDADTDDVPK